MTDNGVVLCYHDVAPMYSMFHCRPPHEKDPGEYIYIYIYIYLYMYIYIYVCLEEVVLEGPGQVEVSVFSGERSSAAADTV